MGQMLPTYVCATYGFAAVNAGIGEWRAPPGDTKCSSTRASEMILKLADEGGCALIGYLAGEGGSGGQLRPPIVLYDDPLSGE